MAFGFAIKKLREDAGISVGKLTEKIGVDAGRWRKWEEKDFDPREEDRQAIEDFFGMPLNKIIQLESIQSFLKVPKKAGNKGAAADEPSAREILSLMAEAFKDQATAQKEQAEILRLQAELMKSIEKGMARADTQATMNVSLGEVRAIVEKLSIGQNKEISRYLKEFAAIRKELGALRSDQAHPGAKDKRKVGDGRGA